MANKVPRHLRGERGRQLQVKQGAVGKQGKVPTPGPSEGPSSPTEASPPAGSPAPAPTTPNAPEAKRGPSEGFATLNWGLAPARSTALQFHWTTWTSLDGRYRASRIENSISQVVQFGAEVREGSSWRAVEDSRQGPGYPQHYASLEEAIRACCEHLSRKEDVGVYANVEEVLKAAGGLALDRGVGEVGRPPKERRAGKVRPPKAPRTGNADRYGNDLGEVNAGVHKGLSPTEKRTPEEVSLATGNPQRFPPGRCKRRLLKMMQEHPEAKVASWGGKFWLDEGGQSGTEQRAAAHDEKPA